MTNYIIYKYPLKGEATVCHMLPHAEVLTVQMQDNTIVIWAKAEPSTEREKRVFAIHQTGHEYEIDRERYVSTVQDTRSGLIWHVFEIV